MPIYEYKCNKCGKHFEYEQKITDEPLTKCPFEICDEEIKGQGEVERLISKNIGFVFNGSGFYLTDYVHKHSSSSSEISKKNNNNGISKSSEASVKTPTENKK